MKYDFSEYKEKISQLNLRMTDHMEEQFSIYYDLLNEWNKVMNLTAITEFHEVVVKHFLDSVSLGYYLNFSHRQNVIDIGTGAGFPGIPLKIMFPELHITLADSLNKRIKFLNEVILQLELENVSAIHARAEDLARDQEHRETYDICVSRAVANLASLSEYCIPFVKIGGKFISYKSGEIKNEVDKSDKAIHLMGGKLQEVIEFKLPDTEYHRSFVVIEKTGHTPKKYPRKAGTPGKNPLYYADEK